jgi:hypothetical protein
MDASDPASPPTGDAIAGSGSGSGGIEHPIGDLVHQLLDAVQSVVAEADPSGSAATSSSLRPAEFCYELDSVISQYLEHNALSPSQYDHIQQQVVNSLAHHLSGDGVLHGGDGGGDSFSAGDDSVDGHLARDHDGNADMANVLHLLDHHFSAELHASSHDLGGMDVHPDSGFSVGGHG